MVMRESWETPLRLPAAAVGPYRIEAVRIDAGVTLPLGPGAPHTSVGFKRPTLWHTLRGPRGLELRDLPADQWEQDRLVLPVRRARTVLVSGMGLGYVPLILAERRGVRKVVIVEPSPEIIELVYPHLWRDDPERRAKLFVLNQDLPSYLEEVRSRQWRFDWAVLQPALHTVAEPAALWDVIVPLRSSLAGIVRDECVTIVGEQAIRSAAVGRLQREIVGMLLPGWGPDEPVPLPDPRYELFWQWMQTLPRPARTFVRLAVMAEAFVDAVGHPDGEALWRDAVARDQCTWWREPSPSTTQPASGEEPGPKGEGVWNGTSTK